MVTNLTYMATKESLLTRREDEGAPLGRIKLVQPCENCFELAFKIKIIFGTLKKRDQIILWQLKCKKCKQNARNPREFRTFWVRETLV